MLYHHSELVALPDHVLPHKHFRPQRQREGDEREAAKGEYVNIIFQFQINFCKSIFKLTLLALHWIKVLYTIYLYYWCL